MTERIGADEDMQLLADEALTQIEGGTPTPEGR